MSLNRFCVIPRSKNEPKLFFKTEPKLQLPHEISDMSVLTGNLNIIMPSLNKRLQLTLTLAFLDAKGTKGTIGPYAALIAVVQRLIEHSKLNHFLILRTGYGPGHEMHA